MKHNACSLTYKQGKMLSTSRVANTIVVETERSIKTWSELVESNRILKFNVMIFDETVVGDPTKLGNVIACKGKGAARLCCVREKQLCVQAPFSSNDGSTLLIAHIFEKKKRRGPKQRLCHGSATPGPWRTKSTRTALFCDSYRIPERRGVYDGSKRLFGH